MITKAQVRPQLIQANEDDASSDTDSDEYASDDDAESTTKPPLSKQQRNETIRRHRIVRHIVVALSVMANACSQQFNILQTMLGYTFYAYKTSRRLIGKANHLGLSSGYKSICEALRSNANHNLKDAKTLVAKGNAFSLCCDNCTYSAPVKNESTSNKKAFGNDTVTFAAEDIEPVPHFTPADISYEKADELNVQHFLPDARDKKHFVEAARCMIAEAFRTFCKDSDIDGAPNIGFPMPVINQIPHAKTHNVQTLRTLPFNEGEISEMIKVMDYMGEQVGIDAKSSEEIVLLHFGDFATVHNQRYIFRYGSVLIFV